MSDDKPVGYVHAKLFARVGTDEEIPLGQVSLPLTISYNNTKKVEVDLKGPFELAKAMLEQVYPPPESGPTETVEPEKP